MSFSFPAGVWSRDQELSLFVRIGAKPGASVPHGPPSYFSPHPNQADLELSRNGSHLFLLGAFVEDIFPIFFSFLPPLRSRLFFVSPSDGKEPKPFEPKALRFDPLEEGQISLGFPPVLVKLLDRSRS